MQMNDVVPSGRDAAVAAAVYVAVVRLATSMSNNGRPFSDQRKGDLYQILISIFGYM